MMISYTTSILLFASLFNPFYHGSLASSSAASPVRLTLFQWPISTPPYPSPEPIPLGEIEYDTWTKSATYTPFGKIVPGPDTKFTQLVRIGLWNKASDGKEEFISTVIDGTILSSSANNPKISIRLDSAGKPWHVEYTISHSTSNSDEILLPQVTVIPVQQGPSPLLNKPIPTGPDGKIPTPEVEKTFLQKYWWLILAGGLLALGGGGGNE